MRNDGDVRTWANELWHRREELPPELWKDLARLQVVKKDSNLAGTENAGRWITGPSLWNFTSPARGEIGSETSATWQGFYQYYLMEFARLVRESGEVAKFSRKAGSDKGGNQRRHFRNEWNHRVKTGEFHRRKEEPRIPRIGEAVDLVFRRHLGQTFQ